MADIRSDVVAVVDDDHGVLDSLKFLLETLGHKVAAFASAAAFLADRTLRPACLIVDHHMPEMTGLELAEQLLRQGTSIPVLLMTGAPSPEIFSRAALLGIWAVLEKPFNDADLLEFVRVHV
jgi:two-component system, LuxR family, response regulator FixJ